jgi:hypothetical protein
VRKQARVSAKQRKAEYFNATTARKLPGKQNVQVQEDQFSSFKRRKFEHNSKSVAYAPTSSKSLTRAIQTSSPVETQPKSPVKARKITTHSHSATDPDAPVKTAVEKKEDAYIAHLESKLGKFKGKMNDGLDGASFSHYFEIRRPIYALRPARVRIEHQRCNRTRSLYLII